MTAEVVVIAGMSGAGSTEAIKSFEEAGWFVMDNLPPQAFENVVGLCASAGIARAAIVVRQPGRESFENVSSGLSGALDTLTASGLKVRTLFLDASDSTLVRRFDEKRRRHPFDRGKGVAAAIQNERETLASIRGSFDVVIDTTSFTPHELRTRLLDLYREGAADGDLEVNILSFGYKHGIPMDADFVFDARFLPNPHWVDELRPLSGTDSRVVDHVLASKDASTFLDLCTEFVSFATRAMAEERRQYCTIAIGCTGGRHRSVVLAEKIGQRLKDKAITASVRHRDIER